MSSNVGTATSAPQIYSLLDTNEDGVISAEELAAALNDDGTKADLPTRSAARLVASSTASAILEVGALDRNDSSSVSLHDVINAYSSAENAD